jgi:hypothetical protein
MFRYTGNEISSAVIGVRAGKIREPERNLPDFYPLNKIFRVTKFPKLSLGSRQKYFPICRFLVTFTYFWYFQILYCMYCLLFKFISPNFCPIANLYVYNLHDFILTGGRDCLPSPVRL